MKRTAPSNKAILAAVGAAQPPTFFRICKELGLEYEFDIRDFRRRLWALKDKGLISIAVEGRVLAFRLITKEKKI